MTSTSNSHSDDGPAVPNPRGAADGFAQTVQEVVSAIGQHAHVGSVFGEPIKHGEVAIIPIASIFGGFGAGAGAGAGETYDSRQQANGVPRQGEGRGQGVGGGFIVQPCAVVELSREGARLRRVKPPGLLSTLAEKLASVVRLAF